MSSKIARYCKFSSNSSHNHDSSHTPSRSTAIFKGAASRRRRRWRRRRSLICSLNATRSLQWELTQFMQSQNVGNVKGWGDTVMGQGQNQLKTRFVICHLRRKRWTKSLHPSVKSHSPSLLENIRLPLHSRHSQKMSVAPSWTLNIQKAAAPRGYRGKSPWWKSPSNWLGSFGLEDSRGKSLFRWESPPLPLLIGRRLSCILTCTSAPHWPHFHRCAKSKILTSSSLINPLIMALV